MTTIEQVIAGLEILKKYGNAFAADHDIIYGPCAPNISAEDAATLEELGWHVSSEFDCYVKYV